MNTEHVAVNVGMHYTLLNISMHRKHHELHELVVISFVNGTRALRMFSTLHDVSDTIGLDTARRTITCGRLANGVIAQGAFPTIFDEKLIPVCFNAWKWSTSKLSQVEVVWPQSTAGCHEGL
ncbi:hypothetical protein CYMTET_31988 [Cymbomonas tetramitiformis]|uniref:Uncharacterized protein n=1 Tax=Cymbomonas tetramitiformis TaxID=36881 RepID=A0AAE0KSB1_9CHLO|nr:hypothetical protein CYMTET_31988 [Cymbomonas tetramitiformis]